MSLVLYHAEPVANSLKCLIPLHEKGLPFESRYMNLLGFEHLEPWFIALNPEGQVPVLVHDGEAINHSSVINEYLEDAFPEAPPLRPAGALACARMRAWNKFVDDEVMAFVSVHGWHQRVRIAAREVDDAAFEALVEKVPLHEQRIKWRTARRGFPQEVLDNATRKVTIAIDRAEAQLARSRWLAGEEFSLADVNFLSHCALSLNRLFPQFDLPADYPRLLDWIHRCRARPGVAGALQSRDQDRAELRVNVSS